MLKASWKERERRLQQYLPRRALKERRTGYAQRTSALVGNEIARALISMVARSTTRSNVRPDTLMQDPHPTERRKPLATRGRTIHSGQERQFCTAEKQSAFSPSDHRRPSCEAERPAKYSRRVDLHQGTRREFPFGFAIVVREDCAFGVSTRYIRAWLTRLERKRNRRGARERDDRRRCGRRPSARAVRPAARRQSSAPRRKRQAVATRPTGRAPARWRPVRVHRIARTATAADPDCSAPANCA